ncbi:MAG: PKD domain-containing protein [Methanobacteriota archaeon]
MTAGTLPPVAILKQSYRDTYIADLVGQELGFNANESYDLDGVITNYSWNFGDGNIIGECWANHTYAVAGNYTVTLTVTDDDGMVGTDTAIANITGPSPPVAVVEPGFQEITAWTAAHFDGSQSHTAEGTIVTYQWIFGFADSVTGITASRTYEVPGNYTVTLRVENSQGLSATDTCCVNVIPGLPPQAIADPAYQTAGINETVSFTANRSYDPENLLGECRWYFGDDQIYNVTGVFATHKYTMSGDYYVTLIVEDIEGMLDVDTCSVHVTGTQAPSAHPEPHYQAVRVNEMVRFNGSLSHDADGEIVAYNWNFGDNATGSGITPLHIYTSSGNFTVTLTVEDNDGYTDTVSCAVNVTGTRTPVAVPKPAIQEKALEEAAIFDGTLSYDPDGPISSYLWNFGDGSSASGAVQAHYYQSPGDYTATLTVEDSDGFLGISECLVKITDATPPAISDVNVASAHPNDRDRLTIYCIALDNVGVAECTLSYLHNGSAWTTIPMTKETTNAYSVTAGPVNQSFTFYINATDGSGNTAVYSDHILIANIQYEVSVDILLSDIDLKPGSTVRLSGVVIMNSAASMTGLWVIASLNGEEIHRTNVNVDGTFALEFVMPEPGKGENLIEVLLFDEINGVAVPIGSAVIQGKQPFPWVMVGLASFVGVSVALGLITEVGKYWLILLFMPLYAKMKETTEQDMYMRGKIHGYILANPGEHYNAIKRALDINNGSLAYHLHHLEKEGGIKSMKYGVLKRFYPKEMLVPNAGPDSLSEAQKMILRKIRETPGISQKDIAALLGISASTINYHVDRMIDLAVVRRERKGMTVRYYETECVKNWILDSSRDRQAGEEVHKPEIEGAHPAG